MGYVGVDFRWDVRVCLDDLDVYELLWSEDININDEW